jgi:RHS repeat-associated protein
MLKFVCNDDAGSFDFVLKGVQLCSHHQVRVTMTHHATQTQKTDVEYAYDHQGARVLKRRLLADGAADGARTRYFFHGLTEEVVKRSVAGAHADTAFEFVTRLDGTLAPSHWQNAAAVSSVADAQRHPGGVDSGTVIRVAPQQWAVHGAGAGGWSYGVTGRRVMSAWVKSGADGKFAVLVSTSVGDRELRYYFSGPSSGAPAYVSSTEAHFPSTLALDGCWHRLERNLAADVAAAWFGATLTGVRGMAFHAYHASSAMWVDDVRFSNAMTLERNSLLPGAVGQIACRRATDATNFGHADAFYFYDHIGNVQGVSSSGGSVAETYTQDAWGNVLSSATTGQWATTFGGRHFVTKQHDSDVNLYYIYHRWLNNNTSQFISFDPLHYWMTRERIYLSNAYSYSKYNPMHYIDIDGRAAILAPIVGGVVIGGAIIIIGDAISDYCIHRRSKEACDNARAARDNARQRFDSGQISPAVYWWYEDAFYRACFVDNPGLGMPEVGYNIPGHGFGGGYPRAVKGMCRNTCIRYSLEEAAKNVYK